MTKKELKLIFISQDGTKLVCKAYEGETVLTVAHRNNVDLEGACEGSLACSTCHVWVDEGWFSRLPQPSESEEDMLDLAFGLTENSRLGCQIVMNESLDGLTVRIPGETRNIKLET